MLKLPSLKQWFLLSLSFGSLLLLPSCASLMVWASKEPVSWEYLKTKSAGLKMQAVQILPSEIHIPLAVIPTFDSAICFSDPVGQFSGQRILIRLKKGLCPTAPLPALVVIMPKPAPGQYVVVYDDARANQPVIGTIEVP